MTMLWKKVVMLRDIQYGRISGYITAQENSSWPAKQNNRKVLIGKTCRKIVPGLAVLQ